MQFAQRVIGSLMGGIHRGWRRDALGHRQLGQLLVGRGMGIDHLHRERAGRRAGRLLARQLAEGHFLDAGARGGVEEGGVRGRERRRGLRLDGALDRGAGLLGGGAAGQRQGGNGGGKHELRGKAHRGSLQIILLV